MENISSDNMEAKQISALTEAFSMNCVSEEKDIQKMENESSAVIGLGDTLNGFTRSDIEALGNRVRVTDTDEETGLELMCYVKCNSADNELLKECRGIIFHKNNFVMKAFPYTTEYSPDDKEIFQEIIGDSLDKCLVYDSHEGTLIRMFNFNGKWFTSTHRKLDAFRSKWSSKESFGSLFEKALQHEVNSNEELKVEIDKQNENTPETKSIIESFQKILNPQHQYMFLLRNTFENRIVCDPPQNPTMYHVGTFINGKELSMNENIFVKCAGKHSFNNIKDMCDYVDNIDYKDRQGVILFLPNNNQIKILNRDYQELFKIRGNEPSIKFRYLQIRMDNRYRNGLHYLYPEMTNTFEDMENAIYEIGKSIYNSYIQRFIKKIFVSVPRENFAVIKEVHEWYLSDRNNNRINLNKVMDVMNSQSPTNINHMIRKYNMEKLNKNTPENPDGNVDEAGNKEGGNQRPRRRNNERKEFKPHKRILTQEAK
jgi:hypothetical protein